MTKNSADVICIMIAAEDKDFELHRYRYSWKKNVPTGIFNPGSLYNNFKNLNDILSYLSKRPPNANSHFFIVYNASCPNKESHLKKLLEKINQTNNLPTLISIGHEQSPLNETIKNQFSSIKESNESFDRIIEIELESIKKELVLSGEKAEHLETAAVMNNISMMVLGGFIAAAGIAAVAIAFTVLNAATFGITGLVVASIGVAAVLTGLGLFATAAYKNKSTIPDIILDNQPEEDIPSI